MVKVPGIGYNISYKSGIKNLPKYTVVKQQEKANYLQNIELAKLFDKFEDDMRQIIETFVYIVKVKYKG